MFSSPVASKQRHETNIWVRLDFIESLLANNGNLPKGWRPRKRVRTLNPHEDGWAWCRAHVNSARSATASSSHANHSQNGGVVSPFNVKLRQVSTPAKQQLQQQSAITNQDVKVEMTITVDDMEHAPESMQNVTVSFTYDSTLAPNVCTANVWWLHEPYLPPSDLTQLEQLHEPAVVYCLKRRYEQDQIYTYTGKILLALNPFRSVQGIYSEQTMQVYSQSHGLALDAPLERPPPHVFAIADDAYRSMMDSMAVGTASSTRGHAIAKNQSILVSGESGAGKTVTTKIVLNYLAMLSKQKSDALSSTRDALIEDVSIEAQVLQSNPILESFGNARTIRNDNSSRFGKYIDIQFNRAGKLVSASIETYLLEKVRLISQAPGERNFHIFYEMLTGLSQQQKREFGLTNTSVRDFRMLAASGTFDRRDGVNDRETFRDLIMAFETVGFTKLEQEDIFAVVAALMHASNLTFRECAMDASELNFSNKSVKAAVALLGVKADSLNDALCRCRIEAQHEVLYKNLTVSQAHKAVEAFVKVTYGSLFAFIVRRINGSIGNAASDATASIGVLDIFGFESFDVNSFEQLCINYCNEALQQQFNRFVFKLEQEEYRREGIDWSNIAFPDNQDVLDLIEKNHYGILSILDEQCRLARCTDSTFARAVYDKCANHPRFEASTLQQGRSSFSIHHYAGLVEYETMSFLEKNKDELPNEAIALLKSSADPFISQLGKAFSEAQPVSPNKARANGHGNRPLHRTGSSIIRESVGNQFSQQLRILRTRIELTDPHYIRCLKPNDDLVPHNFNATVIADQLCCAGVLEAIRVSRVGFPHRYFHDHFVERYGIIAQAELAGLKCSLHGSDFCQALVDALRTLLVDTLGTDDIHGEKPSGSAPSDFVSLGIQMGRTKVFLRRRAFDALEHLRSKKFDDAATLIQTMARGYFARIYFDICIIATIVIQTAWRRASAHHHVQNMRALRAVTVLQCSWMVFKARRVLWALRRVQIADISAVRIQCAWRRCQAKAIIWQIRKLVLGDVAASTIQSAYRRSSARLILLSARLIAWWCQSAYRGAVARQYCAYVFLDAKAAVIQDAWRRRAEPPPFKRLQRAVRALQCLYRAYTAKKELCRLRREAKDISKVVAERNRYRDEIHQLRRELDEVRNSPPKLKDKSDEVRLLRQEVKRLQEELQKAHCGSDASLRTLKRTDELRHLMDELSYRENHLILLKKEVETLRSVDADMSFQSLASEAFGANYIFETASPRRRRHLTITRSDLSETSLLDAETKLSHEERIYTTYGYSGSGSPIDVDSCRERDEVHQLHASIRLGDRCLFDSVLRNTCEACLLINQGDQYGRTALHLASLALRSDMLLVLLSKGAVVNAQDDDGETPLHLAENFNITEMLLTTGRANPNIPNVDGICAIHLAVQRRDINSLRILIENGASVNSADNIRWFTPLHLVALPARNKWDEKPTDDLRLRITQLLCGEHGPDIADLDFQDSDGNAPLHYAVQLENQEATGLVRAFLEKGANANIRNDREQSPLHLLCHNEGLRSLKIHFHDTLRTLMYHGADPNIQSMTGCTPLHLTLYHKDIDSAVQLVSSGADINIVWKKVRIICWQCGMRLKLANVPLIIVLFIDTEA
ncbi:hypothetical protein MPSEU_000892100 [Mayamaea pseudoterrestris]|nr:hypothetical protein MPSEU_000892100 [Mayamaea pseudoterrestris]